MGWGEWPDDLAEQQAAALAEYQAQQHTPFERNLLEALGEIADTLAVIAGAHRPAAVPQAVGDRAAERLAAKHTALPYPFWAGVVRDVIADLQWTPDADPAGRGGELTQPAQEASASAGPQDTPRPGPAHPYLAATQELVAKANRGVVDRAEFAAEFFPQHTQGTAPHSGDATNH